MTERATVSKDIAVQGRRTSSYFKLRLPRMAEGEEYSQTVWHHTAVNLKVVPGAVNWRGELVKDEMQTDTRLPFRGVCPGLLTHSPGARVERLPTGTQFLATSSPIRIPRPTCELQVIIHSNRPTGSITVQTLFRVSDWAKDQKDQTHSLSPTPESSLDTAPFPLADLSKT
jgi:hypothetical protein